MSATAIPSNKPLLPETSRWSLLASVVLPLLLGLSDQITVATALPSIAADLGSADSIVTVSVAYLIALAIAVPVYGKLGDCFGPRRALIAALAVYAAGALLCACANGLIMLSLARALQGLGGGGLIALSHAAISVRVGRLEHARFQSYFSVIGIAANITGPLLGGALAGLYGWRVIFFACALAGLVAIIVIGRATMPALVQAKLRIDWIGLLLLALFVAPLVLSLQHIPGLEGLSLPLAGVAALSLALLVWWIIRTPEALFPRALFANPSIVRSNLLVTFQGATVAALVTLLPLHLRIVYGLTPFEIGQIAATIGVMVSLGGVVAGLLVHRTGWVAPVPAIAMIACVASLAWAAAFVGEMELPQLFAQVAIAGFCLGSVFPIAQLAVQTAAGPGLISSAAGSLQLSRGLGAALGAAIAGAVVYQVLASDPGALDAVTTLLEGRAVAPTGEPATTIASAFQLAFAAIAIFSVGTLLMAWLIPLRHMHRD